MLGGIALGSIGARMLTQPRNFFKIASWLGTYGTVRATSHRRRQTRLSARSFAALRP